MEVAVANRLHYIKYRMENFMYRQEWQPGDEIAQILESAERKGKIRRVLQGGAFLLSWPVVVNLNLGLQERIVIGFLVLLAWAAWFFFAHPRAVRRMFKSSRHSAPRGGFSSQGGYRVRHDQRGQGRATQGQHQRNDPAVPNHRAAPQGQRYETGQYRQGQAVQGQQFQRNYPTAPNHRPAPQDQPVYHPVSAQGPDFAPDFGPDWEG